MKKLILSLLGMFIGAVLCVGITWLIGQIFGQLYQGEDEANRNFGIFLIAFCVLSISGGVIGFLYGSKKS